MKERKLTTSESLPAITASVFIASMLNGTFGRKGRTEILRAGLRLKSAENGARVILDLGLRSFFTYEI